MSRFVSRHPEPKKINLKSKSRIMMRDHPNPHFCGEGASHRGRGRVAFILNRVVRVVIIPQVQLERLFKESCPLLLFIILLEMKMVSDESSVSTTCCLVMIESQVIVVTESRCNSSLYLNDDDDPAL